MGFHICETCHGQAQSPRFPNTSSGDVNLTFSNGHRWVMPDMILHYVADHGWQPPSEFVADVMNGELQTGGRRQTRSVGNVFDGATSIGYLTGTIPTGPVPDNFVEMLENLMQRASGDGMRIQTKGVAMRGS